MRWDKMGRWKRWPREMVIRVNEDPHHLTLLLFVRQAWSIAGDVDIPPLKPVPDCGGSRMPASADASTWGKRWKTAWDEAWSWYQIEDPMHHPTPSEIHEAEHTGHGLNPFIPPFWTRQYEWDGLDHDAYQAWDQSLAPKFPHHFERRSLHELIPAWRSGIDTIIVLPYEGYFAQRLTHRHLVVSADVRNNPEHYSRALADSHSN